MSVFGDLQILAKRKDIRSADRAAIRELVQKLERHEPLRAADRDNIWAYLVRYGRSVRSDSSWEGDE